MEKKSKLKTTKTSPNKAEEQEMENMANVLNSIACMNLRDGTLTGILKGNESVIRQDAVIKALNWYKEHRINHKKRNDTEWDAEKSFAYASKWVALDYIRKHSRSLTETNEMDCKETSVMHPACLSEHDCSSSQITQMLHEAINRALDAKELTPANALVARMIIDDNMSVITIAKRLGVTRGSIYQHLYKVKSTVVPIIESIDLPYGI